MLKPLSVAVPGWIGNSLEAPFPDRSLPQRENGTSLAVFRSSRSRPRRLIIQRLRSCFLVYTQCCTFPTTFPGSPANTESVSVQWTRKICRRNQTAGMPKLPVNVLLTRPSTHHICRRGLVGFGKGFIVLGVINTPSNKSIRTFSAMETQEDLKDFVNQVDHFVRFWELLLGELRRSGLAE